ncbi:MAG: GTPase HflX [Erysipelotrichaceae bacterium]
MKQVILAAVDLDKDPAIVNSFLVELEALAQACALEVVGTITQKLNHVNKALYFNRGKLDELKAMIGATGAQAVVFDDELSGSQQRNLSEILEVEVLDRTMLILEIFASRAQTKEAKLQVQIAQLRYELPRLIGQFENLYSQQGGKGFRGSGETQMEYKKREVNATMAHLEKELADLTFARKTQRLKRDKNALYKVALVGYTNSGKSTILNGFVGDQSDKVVFAKDMLFATLETSTRRIETKNRPPFLLTDTVGFVAKLPHTLVKAFRSTLEEVVEADLLVHVIDASNPEYEMQLRTTNKVLEELGAGGIEMLYVFNKIDQHPTFTTDVEPLLCISARKEADLERLKETIYDTMLASFDVVTLLLPYAHTKQYEYLKQNGELLDSEQGEHGTYITCRLKAGDREKFAMYVVDEAQ